MELSARDRRLSLAAILSTCGAFAVGLGLTLPLLSLLLLAIVPYIAMVRPRVFSSASWLIQNSDATNNPFSPVLNRKRAGNQSHRLGTA